MEVNALIRDGPRAACEEFTFLAAENFTVLSVNTSDGSSEDSLPTGEVVPTPGGTHVDLDVVSLGPFQPLPNTTTLAPMIRLLPISAVA